MNRTQKAMLCVLVMMSASAVMLACELFRLFIVKKTPEGAAGWLLPLILVAILIPLLVWVLKRQSPKEPEADERVKLITNRAAMAAFISAWVILPIVSVLPRFVLGDNGCILAWSLPLFGMGVLLIVSMVYSAAVLVQYISWRGHGDK
jgi:Na+/H+ antiporter NhaC